ncbi:MAG: DNA-binding transcriptional MocR family regulator [Akkermansiaceae bacterium]|jgi:DNA-binding transcriptional MocR family regulator
MNPFFINNYCFPGIRSFIKRNPMFQQVKTKTANSSSEVIAFANEAFQSGRLRAGERFPSPDEVSKLTGASIAESLEAVTRLLRAGSIQQLPSGQLSISKQSRRRLESVGFGA